MSVLTVGMKSLSKRSPILVRFTLTRQTSSLKQSSFLLQGYKLPQRMTARSSFWSWKGRHSTLIRMNHGSSSRIQPFILPDIGEGIKEVTIRSWNVNVGDKVNEFDNICEVESDKATAMITSRFSGVIAKIHYETGDMAEVGKPLVDIQMKQINSEEFKLTEQNTTDIPNTKSSSEEGESKRIVSNVGANPSDNIPTLPSVRRLAREAGVNLSDITATGRNGRILREDFMNHLKGIKRPSIESQTTSSTPVESSNTLDELKELRVPLNGIKRAMFKTMTESVKIPHFGYSEEIDMTRLLKSADRRLNEGLDKIGTFAYIIKMVSLALLEYPMLNASIDQDGKQLIEKHYHNIGIAVDTKAGLVVPNIKNVEKLSIVAINSELLRLRDLGYRSSLGVSDLSGGTFTLSNIGAIGGVFGIPVLVSPEIVIGALGRARQLPRFNSSGNVEERSIMQVVWSADHRVVDGATLSRFSNKLKSLLEEPEKALLNLR